VSDVGVSVRADDVAGAGQRLRLRLSFIAKDVEACRDVQRRRQLRQIGMTERGGAHALDFRNPVISRERGAVLPREEEALAEQLLGLPPAAAVGRRINNCARGGWARDS